jgi:hypothetical protein
MNLASYQVKSCGEKKRTIIYQAGEWEEHSSCFLLELWGQAPHYLSLRFSGGKHEGRESNLYCFLHTDKKVNLIFLIDIRKFRMEQLQSHD